GAARRAVLHAPEVRAVAAARGLHDPAAVGGDPRARGHHGEALVAFLELTKPRITQLVVLTAAAGFYLGAQGRVDVRVLIETLIGVALVAAGTNAFNQLRERDVDARMQRTRGRPLPSPRCSGSCFCGSCRTSWRSPGSIGTTTAAADSSCSRSRTPTGGIPAGWCCSTLRRSCR